jgi:hypothetical protein
MRPKLASSRPKGLPGAPEYRWGGIDRKTLPSAGTDDSAAACPVCRPKAAQHIDQALGLGIGPPTTPASGQGADLFQGELAAIRHFLREIVVDHIGLVIEVVPLLVREGL